MVFEVYAKLKPRDDEVLDHSRGDATFKKRLP
jgi:hypothetical protein